MEKILLLTPYPLNRAPSQRFRFEFYLKSLEENGLSVDHQSFISEEGWEILYSDGNAFGKLVAIISGFARRKWMLLKASKYDIIFIHRELTPLGPPFFEWFLAKVLKKKIIYDFDDAIWMNDGHDGNKLWTWLKWRSKIASICQWSWKVSAGNDYLADFAKQYCDNVVVMPTVVDTNRHSDTQTFGHSDIQNVNGNIESTLRQAQGPVKDQQSTVNSQLTVGWTGSHSTLFYLDMVLPVLKELEEEFEFNFLVIANKNPELPLKNFQFIKWSEENEVADLSLIDIGIMPLEDTEWAKGKCGFKLIQYGAMSIPSIASPVGTNKEVIRENETGLFATHPEEWKSPLKTLLSDEKLRKSLGQNARKHVVDNYSVKSQKQRFLNLFRT